MLRKDNIVVVVPEHSIYFHTIASKGGIKAKEGKIDSLYYLSPKQRMTLGFVYLPFNQQNPGFSLNTFRLA